MNEEFCALPPNLQSRVKANHKELANLLLEIKTIFRQLTTIHGLANPELYVVYLKFLDFQLDLEIHFAKEAVVVLPFIKRYTEELNKKSWKRKPRLFSACPPIDMMYREHKKEKEQFNQIFDKLSTIRIEEGSVFYTMALEKLEEFKVLWDDQLHLEDDILFPGIIEMESILNPLT